MNGRPPCSIGLQQGGIILESFCVFYEEVPVGEVTLEQEGLYCYVRCLCTVDRSMLRLVDIRDSNKFSVGICGPIRDGFGLEKRLPAKYMESGEHYFMLTDIYEREGQFYPISEKIPLSVLTQPEKCRYMVKNSVPGIIIGC